jgi:hypothetical protein
MRNPFTDVFVAIHAFFLALWSTPYVALITLVRWGWADGLIVFGVGVMAILLTGVHLYFVDTSIALQRPYGQLRYTTTATRPPSHTEPRLSA